MSVSIKYIGGAGPLDIPGGDPRVVEHNGTVEVPKELADELVARGDFKKATGGSSAKKEDS